VRTIVSFRSGGRDYAVGIERVRRVLGATGLVPLPDPRPGVAGLLRHDGGTVTVLSALGAGHGQVLVLEDGGTAIGLLVDEVTGIGQVEDPAVGPPPAGQRSPLVAGVLDRAPERRGSEGPEDEHGPAGLLLLLDVDALAGRLRS
jgi:chemotaxis signal transduction protein